VVRLEYDFDEITVDLDVVNCARFVYSERPIDGGVCDFEGNRHFEKSVENGWGAVVPPVARYPSRSQGAVAILCPHGEALGASLAEHPIGLGDRAIGMGDTVTVGSLGTRLQGTATLAIGLGKVQQEGGTVPTDHTGALDQQTGSGFGVTDQGSETAGGDDGEHRSGAGGGGGLSPSLERILSDRWGVSRVWGRNRDSAPGGTRGRGRWQWGALAVLDWR